MNRLRLEFATEQFLAMLNRERVRRGSKVEARTLQDYSPEDRSSLMKSVAAAARCMEDKADDAFEKWCADRSVSAD